MSLAEVNQIVLEPVVTEKQRLPVTYVRMSDEELKDWEEWYEYLATHPEDAADYYSDSGYKDDPDGAADHSGRMKEQIEMLKEERENR